MANKTIQTRIKLKYDSLANWESNNPVLLAGEIAIATIASGNTQTVNSVATPQVLFKVGDGTSTFKQLKWASGMAADVYDWAKAASKPSYTASEVGAATETDITNAIGALDVSDTAVAGQYVSAVSESDGKITVTRAALPTVTDTDTQYQLVYNSSTRVLKLQSKAKGGSWADVSGQSFTISDTTYSDATQSAHGLMTATDKKKLDGIEEGAQKVTATNIENALGYKPAKPKNIALVRTEDAALGEKTIGSYAYVEGDNGAQIIIEDYIGADEVDAKIAAAHANVVDYLGTVANASELAAKEPKNAGDFCRVSTAFGSYHAGDLLLCKTVKNGSTAATWDVIHGEMDKDTWTANSATADGYVTKTGGSSNAGKVWKVGSDGKPGWAADNNTTYSDATQSAHGLMTATDKKKLDGIEEGAEVNQNAISKVHVGTTYISAASKSDTLTLVGSNVTLTPDATNKKVTIGITNDNVTKALGYAPLRTKTIVIHNGQELVASAEFDNGDASEEVTLTIPEYATSDSVKNAALKDKAGNTIFTANASEDVTITVIDCGTSSTII